MNKKIKIALGVVFGVIALIYTVYLLIIPNLINLNTFKPQIQAFAKSMAEVNVDFDKLKLQTYPDFSAKVTADKFKFDKYMTIEKASARVLLFPILFKKLEIQEVVVDNPVISLARQKDGLYDIQTVQLKYKKLKQQRKLKEYNEKQAQGSENKGEDKADEKKPIVEPVFQGMKIFINNYKVDLTDNMLPETTHMQLKGDILEISQFEPKKILKASGKGTLLVENNPNLNFDLKIVTQLPLLKKPLIEVLDFEGIPFLEDIKFEPVKIDPIEKILKYNPKLNLSGDLNLKRTEKLPLIDGHLDIDKLSFRIDGKQLPDSYAKLKFAGKKVDIDSKIFFTPQAYTQINGYVENFKEQKIDLNVKTTDLKLNDLKKFAYSMSDMSGSDTKIYNDIDVSGAMNADFSLAKDKFKGDFNLINAGVKHIGLSQGIHSLNTNVKFYRNKAFFHETRGKLADIPFEMAGSVDPKLIADLEITLPSINLATVQSLVNNSKLLAEPKKQLKDIKNLSGNIQAKILFKGLINKKTNPEIKLDITKLSAVHAPSKTPVLLTGGSIKLYEKTKISFRNIKTTLAESPLNITGEMIGDANNPKNWTLNAATHIHTPYIGGDNKFVLNAKGTPTSIVISDTALYSPEKAALVTIQGSLENNTYLNNMKINISGLNAHLKNPDGRVKVSGNLVVSGKTTAPKAIGTINLSKLSIPAMLLKSKSIDIQLKDKIILLNTPDLNLDNNTVGVNLNIQNKLTAPFIVNSAVITADALNLDKLTASLNKAQASAAASGQSAAGGGAVSASAVKAKKSQDIPVIVNSGKFSAKKLTISKLKNTDTSFNFVLKPANQLAIRDFITHISGGTATGKAEANLLTNKLSLNGSIDNIEINTLATELAKLPGQIYGSMNGKVQLTTVGKNQDALTQNAVGNLNFEVLDGHMGKFASIGYLIRTGQLTTEEEQQTNKFEKLTGNIQINRGVLNIQEILMQGKRMSSYITGSVRIADKQSELTILSRLSGKVVRKLGVVADVSVDKLIKKLPGKWGQIISETRTTNLYPDKDRIPALTAEPLEDDKILAVKIKGELGKVRSIRMFEWLE